MKWQNLKQNKCPKCNGYLDFGYSKLIYKCTKCDFKIAEDKFKNITMNMAAEKIEETEYGDQ